MIGENIRRIRKDKGLTQAYVARQAGITQAGGPVFRPGWSAWQSQRSWAAPSKTCWQVMNPERWKTTRSRKAPNFIIPTKEVKQNGTKPNESRW